MKIEELTDGTEHLTLKLRHNRLTVEEKSAPVMELLKEARTFGWSTALLKMQVRSGTSMFCKGFRLSQYSSAEERFVSPSK